MLRSLRAQLNAIFLGFLLLVGGSVVATFLTTRAQSHDAVVLNLAGRQRMLTQKMTWLALAQPGSPDLAASIQLFDTTLYALRDGGSAHDLNGRQVILPPAPDPILRGQFDEVAQTWASFRSRLERLNTQPPAGPPRSEEARALQAESVLILTQLDTVVSAFEARAQAKVLRLQTIQSAFFVAALLLLVSGYLVGQRRIIQPVATLLAAARRIGEGDLTSPVPPVGDNELGDLGRAFETMRAEIAAGRDLLEARVDRRTRELAAAFELSQEIVAQLELDDLLGSVTDRARTLMQAHAASLCLLTPTGEYLELTAVAGESNDRPGRRQSTRRGLGAQVVGAGQTVVTARACSRCPVPNRDTACQRAVAPLQVGERVLGALCTVRKTGAPFDPDETRALTLLANSAAIAIANARLAETGRRQAEQAAVLAERERLAAELHDHLAQTLSFLTLKTERVEELLEDGETEAAMGELKWAGPAIEAAYEQVRAALVGLRQPPASRDDLAEKLARTLDEFRKTSGLEAELVVIDPSALTLPRLVQLQAWHIVREALTNIRRHANATRVSVRVERPKNQARFTVEDDGRGFDPLEVKGENHLGLAIMRARAERSGGVLIIDSAPGKGTKVSVSFPLGAPPYSTGAAQAGHLAAREELAL